jgi:hypothetical protein
VIQNRPLRPFEQGAHLHVLDWAHTTARFRFQAAGAVQVKAAAKALVDAGTDSTGRLVDLPALEAAITSELRKLYALGHATVRSELDHQASGRALPIGLSVAPAPPNLRRAKTRQGRFPHCASCQMFDASAGVCWGYGNWPVKPNQLCDSFARDPKPKTLALDDVRRDPGRLRARGRLVAQAVAHAISQAVARARLLGISDRRRLRQIGAAAGTTALRVEASHHAGGAISAGRTAGALSVIQGGGQGGDPASIVGARYTSVLDKNTCGPCAEADTGQLIPLGDPLWIPTPNPACLGADRCRCIHVYQLSTESQPVRVPIAAGH